MEALTILLAVPSVAIVALVVMVGSLARETREHDAPEFDFDMRLYPVWVLA